MAVQPCHWHVWRVYSPAEASRHRCGAWSSKPVDGCEVIGRFDSCASPPDIYIETAPSKNEPRLKPGAHSLKYAQGTFMTFEEFKKRILTSLSDGEIFNNPGGGISTVDSFNDERIKYIRGKSSIPLKLEKLYQAYEHFQGTYVTTNQLKKFDHSFDSAARNPSGHSCNCTFGFCVLIKAGLADTITQKGRLLGTNFLKV